MPDIDTPKTEPVGRYVFNESLSNASRVFSNYAINSSHVFVPRSIPRIS